uniref:Dihydropteridine reductase n=1 Tax=Spongospora subterranea TaxID=70186 RepID=A0A0H5QXB6_9EUKA|eukprot:CRZ06367.1 hypothetical protein [Spongospora subterranea]
MGTAVKTIKRALVFGGSGFLGTSIVQTMQKGSWSCTSIDLRNSDVAHDNVNIASKSSEQAAEAVLQKSDGEVDAIISVAGAWKGGHIAQKDIFRNSLLMFNANTMPSLVAAHVATKLLKSSGLLMFTGAFPCLSPAPTMLPYALSKNSVHYLTKSMAEEYPSMKAACILPVILDTPSNRKSMPEADSSEWTPIIDISNQIVQWADDTDSVYHGGFYSVITKQGLTQFNLLDVK